MIEMSDLMQLVEPVAFCFSLFVMLGVVLASFVSASELTENFITIVYNNVPGDTLTNVQTALGISAYITFNGKRILFDVGAETSILLKNIGALGLNVEQIEAIVISHNHWDHVYGLPGVTAYAENPPKLYVPSSSEEAILAQNPSAEVIPIHGPMQILRGIWSTGPIRTIYKNRPLSEQALVISNDEGLYIVTGCAHVGIINIIEHARQMFAERPIVLVAGGLHLVNATEREIRDIVAGLKQRGVRKIAPSHCTGCLATGIFKQEWGADYVRLYLGHTYHF